VVCLRNIVGIGGMYGNLDANCSTISSRANQALRSFSHRREVPSSLKSGSVSFAWTDGEVCRGRWSLVQQTGANYAPSDIAPLWDQVYGSGHYLAHVVGTRFYGKAEAKGNRGNTLDMEFYQSATTETPNVKANSVSIIGIAKDNNNNVSKLTFD